MEGVGDEVFYFGLASVIGGVLLYRAVLYCFKSIGDPTEHMIYDCPICLGKAEFAVETNCGHVYCGNCILEVGDSFVMISHCRR